MARLSEHRIHQIFTVSVLLKGAHALLECALGIALAFVSTGSVISLITWLTQDEFIEDPNDLVATSLLRMAQDFSVTTKNFYVFYLLSHGIVKLFWSPVCSRTNFGLTRRHSLSWFWPARIAPALTRMHLLHYSQMPEQF